MNQETDYVKCWLAITADFAHELYQFKCIICKAPDPFGQFFCRHGTVIQQPSKFLLIQLDLLKTCRLGGRGSSLRTNDLRLQLRNRGIDKVILADMSANLCVESHMRELLEQGFEVAVVKDTTAAAKVPDGDGYQNQQTKT